MLFIKNALIARTADTVVYHLCCSHISPESRMLTTSMLTAINDLRRNKKSLFFIATNRLRAFDSAVIRPGRFDMQLFVGTPNLKSQIIQFNICKTFVIPNQYPTLIVVGSDLTYHSIRS
jgi:SpoVK/Ycf46/Vps4 family AAA+-type ATPase